MNRSKSAEDYIQGTGSWKQCMLVLRGLVNASELEETVKWGIPVYTLGTKHVVGIVAMKEFVAIWFPMGALLKDKSKKLVNAQEGVTKAQRQWRFTHIDQIQSEEKLIRMYIAEAIENQRAGREIKPEKNKPLSIPPELEEAFSSSNTLREQFDSLNLTKQREYAEYIQEAKRPETKTKRLEKIRPMILEGAGLNDKYR